MPDRSLEEITQELQAKQNEIDALRNDSGFREAVDSTSEDLGAATEYIDNTATGIAEAGEDIGENFEQLSDAVDGLQELLDTDALTESMETAGEVAEGVQGGLESTTNVLGEVQEGLETLQEALEAVQQIDDLANADGAEALEAFADAFETVVDKLGPLVDKVPVLGPFFKLYAAGIRNIAVSAGQIEEIVGRNQDLYQEIRPGHSLYLTPEYLQSEELRRLQAEYDALLREAMDAATAEREERDAPPPPGSVFSPVQHVLNVARDRCRGLLPDYDSDAFRRWIRTKTALDGARENHGSAQGGVTMAEMYGEDTAHAQELLDSATARLEAAQEAFDSEGAEHQAALDAYDDCVKRHILIFGGYEGLDEGEFRRIGRDYPQWNVIGWQPPVEPREEVLGGSLRDAAFAVVGGALLMSGMFLMLNQGASPVAGVSGAFVGVAAPGVASSPFSRQVVVEAASPAVSVDDPADSGGDGAGIAQSDPEVASLCNETDHFPEVPATDGDGNTTASPSKQVIGAYVTGLPPGTRIVMEVSRIGQTVGVVNADGYVEFQLPLRSYGTYEITGVTADVAGSPVSLDPAGFGTSFRVSDPEGVCGQSTLTAPTTTTTSTSTTTTTVAAPTSRSVAAGGGAVEFPATVSSTGTPAVSPGTPGTPGSDDDTASALVGLGLVVSGAALLGGMAAPGMADGRSTSGPRTYTADDREFLQEIYEGADEAGMRIAGISQIDRIEDAMAGSKANPVKIGKAVTITLRVGADGSLLPRRGDSDEAATSILRIDVRPGVEFDSDGEAHVVWNAHASQIDTATARITDTGRAGPTSEEWKAKVDGRPDHEVGNDPDFQDWVVESMPDSPGEAVRQALGGIGVTN